MYLFICKCIYIYIYPALAAQEALLRQATEGGEADAGLYSCMIDYSVCSYLVVN